MQICSTCYRPLWDGGHAISMASCHQPGGDICILFAQRAHLAAALRRLTNAPGDEKLRQEGKLLLNQIFPSPAPAVSELGCEFCGTKNVLKPDNTYRVHYTKITDLKPCHMSLKNRTKK